MKHHKTLVSILLLPGVLFFLLSICLLTVSASESENELAKRIENALDVEVFHQKETEGIIKCFDVNESGYYAIGYRNNTIHVYDPLGTFQYGYRFHTEGTYGILLKEDSIVIYLARSNIAAEINSTGKCINTEEFIFTKDFTENVINRTHKQIGTANYILERDIGVFNGSFSRLVKIDEHEIRTVLYDVTTKGYFAGIFHYVILSIFPVAIALIVIRSSRRSAALRR